MNRKNLLATLSTITSIVAVCYYLYTINQAYDGALIRSLTAYFVTLPLLCAMSLYRIVTQENGKKPDKEPLWSTILFFCIIVPCYVYLLYTLIASRFYNLSCLISILLSLVLPPLIFLQKKRNIPPITIWAIGFVTVYLLSAVTTFGYLQVVKPLTVDQATAMVSAQYGSDAYRFIGYIDGLPAECPIGRYAFGKGVSGHDNWLSLDILTGTPYIY